MSETLHQIPEQLDRIELKDMKVGDRIEITTGIDKEAWTYTLTIDDTSSRWPKGQLVALLPNGELSPQVGFILHGSGLWTDSDQNPVQTQRRAFSSYFDSLSVGSFMVGRFEGEQDRAIFDKKGQEVSRIIRIQE
jgi:hypothetical protein